MTIIIRGNWYLIILWWEYWIWNTLTTVTLDDFNHANCNISVTFQVLYSHETKKILTDTNVRVFSQWFENNVISDMHDKIDQSWEILMWMSGNILDLFGFVLTYTHNIQEDQKLIQYLILMQFILPELHECGETRCVFRVVYNKYD